MIPDVRVYPWFLQRPEQTEIFNLTTLHDEFPIATDAQGRVNFPWFPEWQKDPVTIWGRHPHFDNPRTMYNPGPNAGEVTVRLQRTVSLSGHVRDESGKPVSGIKVEVKGRKTHEQQSEDLTDSEGKFIIRVLPDQECLVAVVDENWGAETKLIQIESPDEPIENVDF